MKEMLIRFVVGGLVVSAFAILGDLFKPKSFAGLFGAAPSVALATLGLTIATKGAHYTADEARSMLGGAIALFVYASCVSFVMMRWKAKALWVTAGILPVWFAAAFAVWYLTLK